MEGEIELNQQSMDHSISRARAAGMLLRAFLSQNVAIGAAFGGFGIAAVPIQERFEASRGAVFAGLALVMLTMSLSAPLVASMLRALGLRMTMTIGAVLSGLGYLVLAFAANIGTTLAAFGLLIGPGVSMFGPFPASMLASGWYPRHRGRAVGIANTPLFVALVPLLGVTLIRSFGLSPFFLCLATLHLMLLPVLAGVTEGPTADTAAASSPVPQVTVSSPEELSARTVVRQRSFWLIVLGGGVVSAAGTIGISQIAAIAIDRGIERSHAGLLVSAMGAASVVGSWLVGGVCDRLGGMRTLGVTALGFAASYLTLLCSWNFGPMVAAMLVAGVCGSGIYPCVAMASTQIFGANQAARVLGLYGPFAVPINFLLPLGAGVLRDVTGSFIATLVAVATSCGLVALIFLAGRRQEALHTT